MDMNRNGISLQASNAFILPGDESARKSAVYRQKKLGRFSNRIFNLKSIQLLFKKLYILFTRYQKIISFFYFTCYRRQR